ncbi:hypothetical protein B0J14DRAFT_569075 [Halenospora varia]|nr:hypothetical protein B0J14DRAFT_569075 [Halenospora varia]
MLDTETGKKGLIFLNDEDPEAFGMFIAWLRTGAVAKPPTVIKLKTMLPQAEIDRMEEDLRRRFNHHEETLVLLYCLAEKYDIEALANNTIDAIQDGFYEYRTVFGPGLLDRIFAKTKKNSKLRDLCVGANIIHMDRGCGQLRQEMMMTSLTSPDFFNHMLRWTAQNFEMFARRHREGFDVRTRDGFSMLKRSKLCPCHFHVHAPGNAHKGHEACIKKPMTCGHGDKDDDEAGNSPMQSFLYALASSLCPCDNCMKGEQDKCSGEPSESSENAVSKEKSTIDDDGWVDETD